MSDPAAPTSYETGTAEAWLTVLDYVSRVAQAVEGGDWYYLADKSDALERAVGALRRRVWDDDTNRLDVADPDTGKPLRGEAVMAVVHRNAGQYRASRALYPEGSGLQGGRVTHPTLPGVREIRVAEASAERHPYADHPAALVLADHFQTNHVRGAVSPLHCACGWNGQACNHPAHLAQVLDRAGLLKEDT